MHTNEVYLCRIYIKGETENIDEYINVFIKDTLVTRKYIGVYKDIETNELYHSCSIAKAPIGKPYLNLQDGLVPASSILNSDKKNMSKKKILSKFKEKNNQNTNE